MSTVPKEVDNFEGKDDEEGRSGDAASAKRMDDDLIIVLDPVNRAQIEAGINANVRNYIGGNCSITLSFVGLSGLFRAGLVEWMGMMTYQAASDAGASHVKELLGQMSAVANHVVDSLADPTNPPAVASGRQRIAKDRRVPAAPPQRRVADVQRVDHK